jgi:hypothetical protein
MQLILIPAHPYCLQTDATRMPTGAGRKQRLNALIQLFYALKPGVPEPARSTAVHPATIATIYYRLSRLQFHETTATARTLIPRRVGYCVPLLPTGTYALRKVSSSRNRVIRADSALI